MDYSSYMETIIFRTAAMLGFRRLQSYMLPCLYAPLAVQYAETQKRLEDKEFETLSLVCWSMGSRKRLSSSKAEDWWEVRSPVQEAVLS